MALSIGLLLYVVIDSKPKSNENEVNVLAVKSIFLKYGASLSPNSICLTNKDTTSCLACN